MIIVQKIIRKRERKKNDPGEREVEANLNSSAQELRQNTIHKLVKSLRSAPQQTINKKTNHIKKLQPFDWIKSN